MVRQAVILAGGRGTRLGALGEGRPKALVEVAGRPLIEHQLEVARRSGVFRVLVLTGHLGDVLADYLGDGKRYRLAITCHRESEPLGTAGALKAAEALLEDAFFVFYGDILFDMDLTRLAAVHEAHRGSATLVVHPNDHPHDSDVVETGAGERIVAFHPRTRPPGRLVPNLVNAGVYLLSKATTGFIPAGAFADFGLDVFPAMLAAGAPIHAYNTPEYAKDAGTPERRAAVERDVLSGKVARRNIIHPQQAVFLDRDGVLVEERGDAVTQAEVSLLPGTAAALRSLNASDYLSVVVTNQPGIAKGFLTEAAVADTHKRIDMELGSVGAYVHAWEVCPHHPERGFPGERPELKLDCDCRKPAPGLLLRAAERLHIDLGRSFIVGDRTIDLEAGRRAGVCTIGVGTGHGLADARFPGEPDFLCDDLAAAVPLVLRLQQQVPQAIEIAEAVIAGRVRAIAIGGLSRAGKSAFARLLAWQLRRRGRSPRILPLDAFLKPLDVRRTLPRVADRYGEAAIADAIAAAATEGETMLVEGVPALLFDSVRTVCGVHVFVWANEDARRQRFLAFYAARGYEPEEAAALYAGRDAEERQTILGTAVHAGYVIEDETPP